jgi:hypothetical protein
MECARLYATHRQVTQPGAQLPRRTGGKRHGKHLPWRDMTGPDQLGDPPGDSAGLPGTCAGQYTNRPTGRTDRSTLLCVEAVQQVRVIHHERHPPRAG